MEGSLLLWILAGAMMLVGLAGTVVPGLPGIPLMLAGMLLAAWIDGFSRIGALVIVVLGLLMALSFALELGAAALGAKRVGASRQAILGAVAGTAAGVFFGLPGLILGPFAGAVAGELIARRGIRNDDAQAAIRIGVGAWIGFAVGAVAKLAVAFTMLGVFVAAWLIP